MTKRTLSNSAASVSFAKEMHTVLANTSTVEGKELRLAVAIHNDPVAFDIPNIFGAADKKRGERIAASLAKVSPEFVAKQKAMAVTKGLTGLRAFNAKAEADAARNVVKAATALYTRALYAAYALRMCNAVVTKVEASGRSITFNVHRAVDEAGIKLDVGQAETWSRKNAHDAGRDMLKARHIIKTKSGAKEGAGAAATSTGTQKAITENAATFASTVAALPIDAKVEITTSPEFEKMLATSLRARFAADGVIDMADIAAFLRANDAINGVNVVGDKVGTVRKPREAKTA